MNTNQNTKSNKNVHIGMAQNDSFELISSPPNIEILVEAGSKRINESNGSNLISKEKQVLDTMSVLEDNLECTSLHSHGSDQNTNTITSDQSGSPIENLSELVLETDQNTNTITSDQSGSPIENLSELVLETDQNTNTITSDQSGSPIENLSELVLETDQKDITEISNEDLLRKMPIDTVTRSQIVIENMIFNKYYYVHSDGSRLLYAKRTLSGFNIYLMENNNFLGKMRANIFGTKYNFQTLLEVKYETSFLDKSKPRSFKVKLDNLELINKKPYFNTETNSFSLNFSGRVTRPSVKNFQIVHPLEPTYITLTFGKEENDSYILDYSHPWSILSAFCVGLSALDHKFGCE